MKIILDAYHKLIVDTQYHITWNIFGKFTNIFEISNLTHPNAQSEAILTHPNAHSEPNLELSVNFDQSFGTCRQFLRGAGNFLAIYKGFHFGMEQLLAHIALQL